MEYRAEEIDGGAFVETITEHVISGDYEGAVVLLKSIPNKNLRKQVCLSGLIAIAVINGGGDLEMSFDQDSGTANVRGIVKGISNDNPLKAYFNANLDK